MQSFVIRIVILASSLAGAAVECRAAEPIQIGSRLEPFFDQYLIDTLVLNYSTSAAGSIRVEIQDADGTPIPGFTLDEFPERYGDEIEGVMEWKGGADVRSLAGRSVRLRFLLKDADVYSLQFRK